MIQLKKIWLKYQKTAGMLVLATLLPFGIYILYMLTQVIPLSNDECLWLESYSGGKYEIYFDKVKEGGVTWNAGIRDGDKLVAVNGAILENTVQAQRIINAMKEGEFAKYTIEQNGELKTVKVYIKKLLNFSGIGFTLLAIFWLIVGFIVYNAKPDGKVQKLFFLIGILFTIFVSSFLYYGIGPAGGMIIPKSLILFLSIIWNAAGLFLPVMIIHFFWIFPIKKKIIGKKYTLKILYSIPLLLLICVLALRFIFTLDMKNPLSQYLNMIGNSFMLAGFIIGLVSLYQSYKNINDPEKRKPITVILFFFTVGTTSLIYTFTLAEAISDTIFNSPQYYMPILLVALIPFSFGYSIFRYSLMDVSIVVRNAIFYGSATLSFAFLYFFIIYVIGQSLIELAGEEYQALVLGISFALFAFVFQSTRDRFQEIITRRFYPEQFASKKVLLKFSNNIPIIVGLDNILDYMKEIFVSELKLSNFGILLCDKNNEKFCLVRNEGIEKTDLSLKCDNRELTNFIMIKKQLNQHPIIERNDFEKLFDVDDKIILNERVYTIVPLIIHTKVIGLLLFGLKYSGTQFTGEDMELLNASANQSAVSIENARLYESEAEKLRLERDLENARIIQETLLPHKIPQNEGLDIAGIMIPAMIVGGDYFDVIKVSDSKIFIVVADVSGKGISAALYMSKIQTMVNLFCEENRTPKEILVEINKKIYNNISKNSFITITLALFDTDKKQVSFCRAGHLPLLISIGDNVDIYQPGGIGLGLEKGEIFEKTLVEEIVEYKSEQVYLFCSDGVTESMNKNKELYGLERLRKSLISMNKNTSKKVVENLISSIDNFQERENQSDDISVVVVKIK